MKKLLFHFIASLLLIAGCVSSEKALNKGQYDFAIHHAIKKLRKNPDKTSEILVLEKAYNKAQQEDFDRIAFIQKEGSPDKWDEVYSIYVRIKNRQALIKTLPELTVRDNNKKAVRKGKFNFIDVDNELLLSKQKAAEYFYVHGVALLQKGGRFNARDAYAELQKVKTYYSNFKDIDDQLVKAQEAGVTKVMFKMKKEIPASLPPTFEQELMKISLQDLNQNWIRYYTSDIKGTDYDYMVFVNLKTIDVSPELAKEKYYSESKQVQDGWEYQMDFKGNVMKDSLGNDIKKPKYKTITCNVVETHLSKQARVAGSLDYWDSHTNQLFKTDNIAADSFFEDGFVVVLGGDVSALTPETKNKIGKKPMPFPNPFDMLLQAGGNLKGMVKNLLYENRCILN
ncbi:MAG: hypothetical protein EPN85_13315 [Bacteroidetes bacterium]|nr:MAG: hypothetical protein EPN85_13315 [Bacteroidota bacterium]